MSKRSRRARLGGLLIAGATLALVGAVPAAARRDAGLGSGGQTVGEVGALEVDRTGVESPVGLAFAPSSRSFYVVAATAGSDTRIVRLVPFELRAGSDRAGSARISAAVQDPINVAFDARHDRLLLLAQPHELLVVPVAANGRVLASDLGRRSVGRFGLHDPQGMTVDPATGTIYVLDADLPRIVRIEPGANGRFGGAVASEIDLRTAGLGGDVRGIAFDPATGDLHVREGAWLHELTPAGAVVSTRDMSDVEVATPEAIVAAPSGDLTDDPADQSLYVADSGGRVPGMGRIVELSTAAAVTVGTAAFTSTVVRTVNTGAWSPPSPDPSGIAFVAAGARLITVDGEVEETVSGITHFRGANVWESTLGGTVVRSANISKRTPTSTPMTNEPTGVAWNPVTRQYYVTEDGGKKVFTVNVGADGLIGTADDTWTVFRTNVSPNNNGDPEGITYDTRANRLFVADGVNREIYAYSTSGTPLFHFDVQQYGISDPETVEFNSVTGTLFVLSNKRSGPKIAEVTTNGALVQIISVSAVNAVGGKKPAGLAYAPASDGSGARRFYIADRGIDNNSDPKIVDGKIFELTAP